MAQFAMREPILLYMVLFAEELAKELNEFFGPDH